MFGKPFLNAVMRSDRVQLQKGRRVYSVRCQYSTARQTTVASAKFGKRQTVAKHPVALTMWSFLGL